MTTGVSGDFDMLQDESRHYSSQPLRVNKEQYLSPIQDAISPDMLYNSSPDLSLSGSESEQYYSTPEDTAAFYSITKMWNQQNEQLMATLRAPQFPTNNRPLPKFEYDACNPSIFLSPPASESMIHNDTVGTRYDIFSRLPLPSDSSSFAGSSGLSSDVSSMGYSDYEPDYLGRPDYGYRAPVPDSSSSPSHSSSQVPFMTSMINGHTSATHDNQMPVFASESEYEADYASDAFSPTLSAEDTSDFSSPELYQGRRFPEPVSVKKCIPTWQPILTADPFTRQTLFINADDSDGSERERGPGNRLDVYITGPNTDGKYTCNYNGCGKLFGKRYNIRTHIQTHLSDKPHSCSQCGARFVRQHDLRRHAKIHTDAKQYVCQCGKGFTRRDALTRHRLRQICVGGTDHVDHIDHRDGLQ
ncbi:hypothetical protein BZA70DRAFT_276155 [Myxozyma melibiosi]|uniref:C2H2-type domain-containing protein n=1 Tax=Myxozyma melibiosi TaxID=54550 RepID=A0ABR1F8U5_9ASCO